MASGESDCLGPDRINLGHMTRFLACRTNKLIGSVAARCSGRQLGTCCPVSTWRYLPRYLGRYWRLPRLVGWLPKYTVLDIQDSNYLGSWSGFWLHPQQYSVQSTSAITCCPALHVVHILRTYPYSLDTPGCSGPNIRLINENPQKQFKYV